MADALKRVGMSRYKPFQDRCMYFFYQHADTVFGQGQDADANDLALAKHIWAGSASREDMAFAVMSNSTIGGYIDNDNPDSITDSDIEYAVVTEDRFNQLAQSYSAAGMI